MDVYVNALHTPGLDELMRALLARVLIASGVFDAHEDEVELWLVNRPVYFSRSFP